MAHKYNLPAGYDGPTPRREMRFHSPEQNFKYYQESKLRTLEAPSADQRLALSLLALAWTEKLGRPVSMIEALLLEVCENMKLVFYSGDIGTAVNMANWPSAELQILNDEWGHEHNDNKLP